MRKLDANALNASSEEGVFKLAECGYQTCVCVCVSAQQYDLLKLLLGTFAANLSFGKIDFCRYQKQGHGPKKQVVPAKQAGGTYPSGTGLVQNLPTSAQNRDQRFDQWNEMASKA